MLFKQTARLRHSSESQRIQPIAWLLLFLRSQFRPPRLIGSLHYLEKLGLETLLQQIHIGHHAMPADEAGLEQYIGKIRDLAKKLSNLHVTRIHRFREPIHLLGP